VLIPAEPPVINYQQSATRKNKKPQENTKKLPTKKYSAIFLPQISIRQEN
jgi:hypothetical protein